MTPTDRFFEAVEELAGKGIASKSAVCREIGCDRRNFAKQAADHTRRILQPEWLGVLVLSYGVNADWLLTGRGAMFRRR